MSIRINPKLTKSACLLLFGLILGWHYPACSSSNMERAIQCFESYIEALQQGSEEGAKEFWNKEEIERYKIYDWQWGYLAFRRLDPRHLNYKIISTEEKDGYVALQVEWYYREGKVGRLQKDIRYFIEEGGKMVGANPILIHTRDWLQKESEHFVYHYKNKQDEPTIALLDEMDQFYERIVDLLQVNYKDEIYYYKCSSSVEVGRLFEMEASLARSQMTNGVVASKRKFVPHEIVHIISYRILPQDEEKVPPEYLNEGLAYYLGGASFFSPELLLSWAKKKLERNENVLLDSLIRDPWMYGTNEGAGLVSSFVKFLIEIRGIVKFKRLFAAGETLDEQREALRAIYPKSADRMQEEWTEFVLSLPLPEVRFDEPINCRKVFYIEDHLGDDKGDGDYTYPKNKNALPGIFDLAGFKLSLDYELVYFQLQFADLNLAEISSDETFNGTFAAIAIDSDNEENSGNTRLFFDNGNFEFSKKDGYEFVIEVSNAGILVYDQKWIWQALFLKTLSQKSHIRGNEISFAIPQKILGIPDSSWKFQVLTGGQRGGYKNTANGVGRFMKVGEQSTPDQGGGGTNTDFNPDVYDILAPQGTDQIKILSNYDVAKKKKAVIPMIKLKQR
ncbi:MAG: hypothetical protein KAX39_06815 [candidate division Zixibacteria bacterium]|nr:hypothetical protein [candidate division Zixibacteria bacterium]